MLTSPVFLAVLCPLITIFFALKYLLEYKVYSQPVAAVAHTPPVSLILPVKGNPRLDMAAHLRALLEQEYKGVYEIIVAVESEADPIVRIVATLQVDYPRLKLVVAGLAKTCAQKNHNILEAIQHTAPASQYLVFADLQICPHPAWLKELVQPLADPNVDVVTGYRRFTVSPGTFRVADYLLGVIVNGIGLSMYSKSINPIWGGSNAVRKDVFCDIIAPALRTVAVDDILFSKLVTSHRLQRQFQNSCIVASNRSTNWQGGLAWLTRQIQYVQLYQKHIFWLIHLAFVYILLAIFLPAWLLLTDQLASPHFWMLVALLIGQGALLYIANPANARCANRGDKDFNFFAWVVLCPLAAIFIALALIKAHALAQNGIVRMVWKDVVYTVDQKTGRVIQIARAPIEQGTALETPRRVSE